MKYFVYTYYVLLNKLADNEVPKLKFKIWSFFVTFFFTWQLCLVLFIVSGKIFFGSNFLNLLKTHLGDSRNQVVILITIIPILLISYVYSKFFDSQIEVIRNSISNLDKKSKRKLKIKIVIFHLSIIITSFLLVLLQKIIKQNGIV
jgi:hypothetical protein